MKGIDEKKMAPKAGGGGGAGALLGLGSLVKKVLGGMGASALYSAWAVKDRKKKKVSKNEWQKKYKKKDGQSFLNTLKQKYPEIVDDPEWVKIEKRFE